MSETEPLFETVALIGLGLIGSSVAHAARRAGLVRRIVGCARSAETREKALEIGFIDAAFADPAEAVAEADLVVLCVPVGNIGVVCQSMAAGLKAGAIVSDVGSVKGAVIDQARATLPSDVYFIPAHPIAGTEQSGPESGFAELFENRWCILTPLAGTPPAQTERLATFWRGLGAQVERMAPEHHDRVLAVVSHIPHLIAYTVVGTAKDLETVTDSEVIKYSASGFRDFTRIAASDPTMWRDVFLHNRTAVLEVLGRFTEDLFALQRAIRWGDGEMLFDYFTHTRDVRRGVVDAGQDTPAPDFGRHAAAAPAPEE